METFLILSIILLGANSVFWPFWIYRRFRFPDNLEKQITDIEKILSVQQTNSEKFRDGVRNLSKDIDRVIVGIESSKNSLGKIDGIESTLSKQQSDTQKFYDDTKSLLSAVNQAAQDDSIEKKIDGIKGTLSGQQIDNQKSHEDTRCLLQSIEKTNLTQQDDHKNFHLLVQQVHQRLEKVVHLQQADSLKFTEDITKIIEEIPKQDNSTVLGSLGLIANSLQSLESQLGEPKRKKYIKRRQSKKELKAKLIEAVQGVQEAQEALQPQPTQPVAAPIVIEKPASELKSISESLQILVQAEQKRLGEADYLRQKRIEGRKIAAESRNQKQGPVPERVLTWGTIPGSSGLIPPKNYKEN
jgi:hypothetical protein